METLVVVTVFSFVTNALGFLVVGGMVRRISALEKRNASLAGLVVGLCKASGVEVPADVLAEVMP